MSAATITHPATAAKAHLRAAGWTYRTAAAHLGVSYQHISYVLNGQRTSRSLLSRLTNLPRKSAKARALTKSQIIRKAIKNEIKQPA